MGLHWGNGKPIIKALLTNGGNRGIGGTSHGCQVWTPGCTCNFSGFMTGKFGEPLGFGLDGDFLGVGGW